MYKIIFGILLIVSYSISVNHTGIYSFLDKIKTDDYNETDWVPRVLGGTPVWRGEIPYQVALKTTKYKNGRKIYYTFCGATIVGPTKLISSASCFKSPIVNGHDRAMYPGRLLEESLRRISAVAGCIQNEENRVTDRNGQVRSLFSVHYPKKFEMPFSDISVVFLKRRFFFNRYIRPIPMASRRIEYRGACLVSGYGVMSWHNFRNLDTYKIVVFYGKKPNGAELVYLVPYRAQMHSRVLRKAYLYIVPTAQCARQLNSARMVVKDLVCTSADRINICEGDYGGPFVCKGTGDPADRGMGILAGVAVVNLLDAPSLFTRVSSHRGFIDTCGAYSIHGNKMYYIVTFFLIIFINWWYYGAVFILN